VVVVGRAFRGGAVVNGGRSGGIASSVGQFALVHVFSFHLAARYAHILSRAASGSAVLPLPLRIAAARAVVLRFPSRTLDAATGASFAARARALLLRLFFFDSFCCPSSTFGDRQAQIKSITSLDSMTMEEASAARDDGTTREGAVLPCFNAAAAAAA
jgi:hypothetical protein